MELVYVDPPAAAQRELEIRPQRGLEVRPQRGLEVRLSCPVEYRHPQQGAAQP